MKKNMQNEATAVRTAEGMRIFTVRTSCRIRDRNRSAVRTSGMMYLRQSIMDIGMHITVRTASVYVMNIFFPYIKEIRIGY